MYPGGSDVWMARSGSGLSIAFACIFPRFWHGGVVENSLFFSNGDLVMTKSDPNTGGSVVTYIFELGLIGDPEICKNFIEEAGIYTHGCDEPKTIRFEWYLSADETSATLLELFEDSDGAKLRVENLLASPLVSRFQELFEVKSFTVLGPVKEDLKDMVGQFGAEIRKYASGFYRL